MKLRIGFSYIILAVAVGKVTAAIIQFANGWVKNSINESIKGKVMESEERKQKYNEYVKQDNS